MRVYWRNNVKDLSLLYRDYFVLGDLQGMVFRHKTLHFTAELTGKENTSGGFGRVLATYPQGKYKRKFAAMESWTLRIISSENNLS